MRQDSKQREKQWLAKAQLSREQRDAKERADKRTIQEQAVKEQAIKEQHKARLAVMLKTSDENLQQFKKAEQRGWHAQQWQQPQAPSAPASLYGDNQISNGAAAYVQRDTCSEPAILDGFDQSYGNYPSHYHYSQVGMTNLQHAYHQQTAAYAYPQQAVGYVNAQQQAWGGLMEHIPSQTYASSGANTDGMAQYCDDLQQHPNQQNGQRSSNTGPLLEVTNTMHHGDVSSEASRHGAASGAENVAPPNEAMQSSESDANTSAESQAIEPEPSKAPQKIQATVWTPSRLPNAKRKMQPLADKQATREVSISQPEHSGVIKNHVEYVEKFTLLKENMNEAQETLHRLEGALRHGDALEQSANNAPIYNSASQLQVNDAPEKIQKLLMEMESNRVTWLSHNLLTSFMARFAGMCKELEMCVTEYNVTQSALAALKKRVQEESKSALQEAYNNIAKANTAGKIELSKIQRSVAKEKVKHVKMQAAIARAKEELGNMDKHVAQKRAESSASEAAAEEMAAKLEKEKADLMHMMQSTFSVKQSKLREEKELLLIEAKTVQAKKQLLEMQTRVVQATSEAQTMQKNQEERAEALKIITEQCAVLDSTLPLNIVSSATQMRTVDTNTQDARIEVEIPDRLPEMNSLSAILDQISSISTDAEAPSHCSLGDVEAAVQTNCDTQQNSEAEMQVISGAKRKTRSNKQGIVLEDDHRSLEQAQARSKYIVKIIKNGARKISKLSLNPDDNAAKIEVLRQRREVLRSEERAEQDKIKHYREKIGKQSAVLAENVNDADKQPQDDLDQVVHKARAPKKRAHVLIQEGDDNIAEIAAKKAAPEPEHLAQIDQEEVIQIDGADDASDGAAMHGSLGFMWSYVPSFEYRGWGVPSPEWSGRGNDAIDSGYSDNPSQQIPQFDFDDIGDSDPADESQQNPEQIPQFDAMSDIPFPPLAEGATDHRFVAAAFIIHEGGASFYQS